MAATYGDATVIHGSSRVTYNGGTDSTAGTGTPTGSATASRPALTATAPRTR